MYVCEFAAQPGILFSTSSDQTGLVPGLVCKRLDAPLPSSSTTQWFTFNKLLRLIESFPF
jgi:hypothetical protein